MTPPPRYLPSDNLGVSPTLSMFMRVGLPGASPRSMDIWRTGHRIDGRRPEKALRRLATRMTEGWSNEGASGIEISINEPPANPDRVQLDLYIRFRAFDEPTHTLARWFMDTDGEVFRISIGGPPDIPWSELETDLEAVAKSWRRIGEVGPPIKRRRFGIFSPIPMARSSRPR